MSDRADLSKDLDVAVGLARAAGEVIAEAIGLSKQVELKSPINLVTATDRKAEGIILEGLRAAFPEDAIVAEETASARPADGPCWYVDPLDGTTNFVHGLPHCSVSIARFRNGRPELAVVHDPMKSETFTAAQGTGARLNDRALTVSPAQELSDSLLVTGFPYDRRDHIRFYLDYFEAFILKAVDVRRFGSAALDLCYVAAGRFDGFWEWGLSPWDTAAGWLVVEEAGGRVSDFEGGPYDAWTPRILATNSRIHEECLGVLAGLPDKPPSE